VLVYLFMFSWFISSYSQGGSLPMSGSGVACEFENTLHFRCVLLIEKISVLLLFINISSDVLH